MNESSVMTCIPRLVLRCYSDDSEAPNRVQNYSPHFRPLSQGSPRGGSFLSPNSARQLSTIVNGSGVVCSMGTATRNLAPSLVAFASENQAEGVRNRNCGVRGRNAAPAVTATDITAPSGAL